ncbi:uncharacterized protein TRUGW13939_09434 [Talaromyces rugulosus]|uniref:Uncharacterized protein n=1 Tax=Talaromyces rugulosus TaxID=121627 RepID=A0A7H8R9T5_TALRU|nr:uncharacterized protein TRUGW13939_09434 [Talaromyces rugulosus]QKX62275.1 hypothetical protein TRUGW13939_09434 [Talaromyces rugulosus]
MPQTISPTNTAPLAKNANHHADVSITTLILEIQSLCHARDHSTLSSSPSSSPDTNTLQALIRKKLDRLQHHILKREMRKLDEQLDYDPLSETQLQQQHNIETDDDDGALLPVPLKIGSRRVRAKDVQNILNVNNNVEDANTDPLVRLEKKVLEVQIYTSN